MPDRNEWKGWHESIQVDILWGLWAHFVKVANEVFPKIGSLAMTSHNEPVINRSRGFTIGPCVAEEDILSGHN